jgi:hypothetical protein
MNFESKVIWAHKTQDWFLKFNTTKMPTSLLRCLQRTGFLSTLNLSERPPRSIRFFAINPHTEEGNINFPGLNHKLGSFRATPRHLGDKSPRVTNMNEIIGEDERSALAQVNGSLKDLLQSSLNCSRIKREASEWGGGAQDLKLKYIFCSWSGQPKWGRSGSLFIAPTHLLLLEVLEHRIYPTYIGYVRWEIQTGSNSAGSDISVQGGVQCFSNPMKARHIQWIRYIRPGVGYVWLGQLATVLEPDGNQIYLADLGSVTSSDFRFIIVP